MLRPTNIKKQKYHTSISSNQVIWDGPDIPCIDLCKGDTVTDVVYKLANELCKVVEDLDPATYNLECLNLTECEDITFKQLFQTIITTLFCGENPLPPSNGDNCCDELNYIPHTVLYTEDQNLTTILEFEDEFLLLTEYTVPTGGGGTYEIMFNATVLSQPQGDIASHVDFRLLKNNTATTIKRRVETPLFETDMRNSLTLFKSNISLVAGDVISIGYISSQDFAGGVEDKVFKITKIG
jgi:hypothetical protein